MLYEIVNQYGQAYRPYISEFVNHLPMAQLALYRMTGDLERVKQYSAFYADHFKIDPLQTNYPPAESMDACIGNRQLYEPCLDHLRDKIASHGVEQMVSRVLNGYPLGLSSGLFHVLIRLGYAVEGYRLEPEFTDEIARSLAYYLTAYREAKRFDRQVTPAVFADEMDDLIASAPIQRIIKASSSLGQTLQGLYRWPEYMQAGAVINGNAADKISGLLDCLIPLYLKTHHIIVLHCITGLHAVLMLQDHFEDLNGALDILTTCITTHILASKTHDHRELEDETHPYSWDALIKRGSASTDVHTIKLAYSCHQLHRVHRDDRLKQVALSKIESD